MLKYSKFSVCGVQGLCYMDAESAEGETEGDGKGEHEDNK